MIISNFLRNRKSVREFSKKNANYKVLDDIRQILRSVEKDDKSGSIQFKLYENGENVSSPLQGKAGYSGVMISSPHYIALIEKNKDDSTKILGGYYMEKLITKINQEGFGTCWVGVKNIDQELKKKVFGSYEGDINFILAFGYEKRRNPFNTEAFSEKISIEEYVFDGEMYRKFDTDDLEARGLMDLFYYLRFAPSTKNLQAWRFLIKGNDIKLYLQYKEWDDSLLVDAGIIMYYFEVLASYQGINNKWKLLEDIGEDLKRDNCNYRLVAEYSL